ncbi:MAG: N-formylglutamate amidohydrolase [Robiginitomaculum sp.]|nr:MAG: N-formylglutamate amidohydrolase [Robiginitomaculum sp.]
MNVWSTLDAVIKPTRHMPWPELKCAFTSYTPAPEGPVLFAAPHSGRRYPEAFKALSVLDAQALRMSEDAWVDELFAEASQYGASLLSAHFPRAMVDVNRAPDELDTGMYYDHCPAPAQRKSARVMAGLGVIPRMVAAGRPIYAQKLSYSEAVERLHHLHTPYHETMAALLNHKVKTLGSAILIDCHSMPSSCAQACPGGSADFILGDGHGRTCRPGLIAHIEHALMALGYRVLRNTPYAGGYTTLRYGQPARGFEALQIEINRALYMDEASLQKTSRFSLLRRDMQTLGKTICKYASAGLR